MEWSCEQCPGEDTEECDDYMPCKPSIRAAISHLGTLPLVDLRNIRDYVNYAAKLREKEEVKHARANRR